MTTSNLDAINLRDVEGGGYGFMAESVMQRLYNISPEDRPLIDMISSSPAESIHEEWTGQVLAAANKDNAVVDGADLTGTDNSATGNRFGNYLQQMVKVVQVSTRAQRAKNVQSRNELVGQVMDRQKELRRDEEAAFASNNAAVLGTTGGTPTAGKLAGLGSWMIGDAIFGSGSTDSNRISRGTTGTDPVLSGSTNAGGVPTTAPGAGNKRGITETLLRQVIRACYNDGGKPSVIMSIPDIIEVISNYMFTSSARVATIQTQAPQGNRTGNDGRTGGGVVAQGAVNVFVSNFGTLELVPNRFQEIYTAADTGNVANVFVLDPEYWERKALVDYASMDLAKVGLSDRRAVWVDSTLCAMAPQSSGVIADVNPSTAMTA